MKTTETIVIIENEMVLPALYGDMDRNLRLIENSYGVILSARGNRVQIEGDEKSVSRAERLIRQLADMLTQGVISQKDEVNTAIQATSADPAVTLKELFQKTIPVSSRKRAVALKNEAQRKYVESIRQYDVVFAIGPAGTGKTYLAVAQAVAMLQAGKVDRIVLTRPAVEAGERLGFLPGDLKEKIDPYLRPLYDALHDMMGADQVMRRMTNGEIEVAPLAFMRGRTLSHCYAILDEAQNTTPMQMKMFLTRMGEGTRMVITGDLSQVDLPSGIRSGLRDALDTLEGIQGIGVTRFEARDVVRHPLVARIVGAYDQREAAKGEARRERERPRANEHHTDDGTSE